jgi:hypothetical protein
MSSVTSKNFPALEMARCPNCDYAIEQMGAQTNCPKCGKRLTIHCINCQTNNPPIFQYCIKCGSDYRFQAVEHFSKRLAKLEFELGQYGITVALKQQAALFEQIGNIAVAIFTVIVVLFCLLVRAEGMSLVLLLSIPLFFCVAARMYGKRLSLLLARLPGDFYKEWTYICSKAARNKTEYREVSVQLKYYQHELNLYRQRAATNPSPQKPPE